MASIKKKKVLIHSLVFSPDGVSTAYLYNDLALGLQRAGLEVVVLTTTPHYNLVPQALLQQPLLKKWGGLFYESNFHGIRVIHVPQKKYKRTLFRLFGFLYWHLLALIIGISLRRIGLIISPSPPLTIGLLNIVIGFFKQSKVVYNVQEIYPDFLINQGQLRSSTIIHFLKWMERFVYRHSDVVVTIDQQFYDTIVPRFKDSGKLKIIPNFVDTDLYRPIEQPALDTSMFISDETLKVMYAGNIGYAQDWEPLLEVAQQLKSEPITFYVIGEGVEKKRLNEEVKGAGLQNIRILPYQARELMPSIVSFADLHFIFMNPRMEEQGFPSKVYTIMACAKPLMVISGERTPLYQFLKDKDCAFLIGEKDKQEKVNKIKQELLHAVQDRNRLQQMGNNGYEVIHRFYSQNVVVEQYVQLIKGLMVS